MTQAGPEVSREEHRALWLSVVRWPLKGGMLLGVVVFAVIAYASVAAEGGYSPSQRDQRGWAQAVVIFAAVAALGHYAWRAISCTWPAERDVPWLRDSRDDTTPARAVGLFLSVLFLSFLPVFAWLLVRTAIVPAVWVDWLVIALASAAGGACLPLGLAGAIVRGSPFAALPGAVQRMRRAAPDAARIASMTGVVFVGCLVLSFWIASRFIAHPTDVALPDDLPRGTPDMVGPWMRAGLFALRATGFYAALVSFRVAGLLVREVAEIREVLS